MLKSQLFYHEHRKIEKFKLADIIRTSIEGILYHYEEPSGKFDIQHAP